MASGGSRRRSPEPVTVGDAPIVEVARGNTHGSTNWPSRPGPGYRDCGSSFADGGVLGFWIPDRVRADGASALPRLLRDGVDRGVARNDFRFEFQTTQM